MKKIIAVIALYLLGFGSLKSQPAWWPVNSGTAVDLTDVYFLTVTTGFTCGGSYVYKTTNGGYNWTSKMMPDTTNLNAVRFLNSSTGYACGGKYINENWSLAHLFKTTNAGEIWTKIYEVSGMTIIYFTDVFPVDSMVYVTIGGYASYGAMGGAMRSTNNGLNFTGMIFPMESGYFSKISFVNAQTGWVTSSYGTDVPLLTRKAFKTTDGGMNWEIQYRDSTIYGVMTYPNFEMQFVNQNTGYGMYRQNYISPSNNVRLLKSTNGGTVWDSILVPYALHKTMFFASDSIGWLGGMPIAGSNINIIRTSNRGVNWHTSWSAGNIINSIYFVNEFTGWAVGDGGVILKTFTSGLPGTGVRNISDHVPDNYMLAQNYPNPFNPNTNIKFAIPKSSSVKIAVYDITGKELEVLLNQQLQAGTYQTNWNALDYSSGMYFYKMIIDGYSETKKMLLVK